jgi:GGDEF domain-containing protein
VLEEKNLDQTPELPVLRFVVALLSFAALIHVAAIDAGAQRFTFQHYEQEEGLKNHDVFKLIQDKTGLLGATWVDPDTISVVDMIRRADEALYAAKAFGRNRVVFYTEPSKSDALFDMP